MSQSNCPFMKYCPVALGGGSGMSGMPVIFQQPQRVVHKPRISVSDIIFYIFLGLWVLFIIFAFMESNSIFDEFLQFPSYQQPVQLKIYVSEPLQFPLRALGSKVKAKDGESEVNESEAKDTTNGVSDSEAKVNDIPPLVSDSESDSESEADSDVESEAVVSEVDKAKSE